MQSVTENIQVLFAAGALGLYTLGAAVLLAVLIDSLRLRLGLYVVIAATAATLYHSSPRAYVLTSKLGDDVLFIVSTIAIGLLAALVLRIPLRGGSQPVTPRTVLRGILLPSHWQPGAPPVSHRAQTKRWFAAVAAGTGCWAGLLMADGSFWEAFVESIQPARIVVTLAITAVVIVLIGPVEEYVLGKRVIARSDNGLPDMRDHEQLFEDLLQNFSWRAIGRIALVIFVGYEINVLHSSLEHASSQPALVALAFIGVVGPMVTTYYWSAALQLDVPSVARRAGWTSVTLFAVMLSPLAIAMAAAIIVLATQMPFGSDHTPIVTVGLAVVGFVLVVGIGLLAIAAWLLVTASVPSLAAFIGGVVLDRARRRRDFGGIPTTLIVGLGILAAELVLAISEVAMFAASGINLFSSAMIARGTFNVALGAFLPPIGWTAGLILSGFPQIVVTSGATVPDADAPLPLAADTTAMGAATSAASVVGSVPAVALAAAARAARSGGRLRRAFGSPAAGIITGALGCLVVTGGLAYSSSSGAFLNVALANLNMDVTERIDALVESVQPSLPMQVAPTLALTEVRRDGTTMVYVYRVAEGGSFGTISDEARANVARGICADRGGQIVLGAGGNMSFVYQDSAANELARVDVAPADCNGN